MKSDPFRNHISILGSQPVDPFFACGSLSSTVVSCPVSHSEKFAGAFEQLRVFGQFGENWDGYGAARIHGQVIAHARSLLTGQLYSGSTLGLPEITPMSNGTLVVEWQGSNGEAALEIGNTRFSGIIKSSSNPTLSISGDTDKLIGSLPLFIAPLLNPRATKAAAITPVEYDTAVNV